MKKENLKQIFWPVPAAKLVGDTTHPCPACLNAKNMLVRLPGEPGPQQEYFDYVLCRACGTLAIVEIPLNIGLYYNKDYYSFKHNTVRGVKAWLKTQRDMYELFQRNILGAILAKITGTQWRLRALRPLVECSFGKSINFDSSILDVGCGTGKLLFELSKLGFRNLTGIDLFVPSEIREPGLNIIRADLAKLTGQYDLVMFHHSFEHMPQPEVVLRDLKAKMHATSIVLLGIPLSASFGWLVYGGNWAQLDPPRHLYLFSLSGFKSLAQRMGFQVLLTRFDSTGDFFVWSEMRKRGLSEQQQNPSGLFTPRELASFENQAQILNETGQGEQATFFLSLTKRECET